MIVMVTKMHGLLAELGHGLTELPSGVRRLDVAGFGVTLCHVTAEPSSCQVHVRPVRMPSKLLDGLE